MTLEQILKKLGETSKNITLTYFGPSVVANVVDESGDFEEEHFDTLKEAKDWLEEKIP